jgi:hypothetical protein
VVKRNVPKCPHVVKGHHAVKTPHMMTAAPVGRRGAGCERRKAERDGSAERDDTVAKHDVTLPFLVRRRAAEPCNRAESGLF